MTSSKFLMEIACGFTVNKYEFFPMITKRKKVKERI